MAVITKRHERFDAVVTGPKVVYVELASQLRELAPC
jgi:hypothetical protein